MVMGSGIYAINNSNDIMDNSNYSNSYYLKKEKVDV